MNENMIIQLNREVETIDKIYEGYIKSLGLLGTYLAKKEGGKVTTGRVTDNLSKGNFNYLYYVILRFPMKILFAMFNLIPAMIIAAIITAIPTLAFYVIRKVLPVPDSLVIVVNLLIEFITYALIYYIYKNYFYQKHYENGRLIFTGLKRAQKEVNDKQQDIINKMKSYSSSFQLIPASHRYPTAAHAILNVANSNSTDNMSDVIAIANKQLQSQLNNPQTRDVLTAESKMAQIATGSSSNY